MKHFIRHAVFACAMTSFAILTTQDANAYDFDEMCAPVTEYDTSARQLKMLVILDTSLSMDGDGGGGKTKFQIAKEVIAELAQAVGLTGPCDEMDRSGCDAIQLGLGRFDDGASLEIEPAEDSYTGIQSTLDSYTLDLATEHGNAAKITASSMALQDPDSLSFGLLVTDGAPWSKPSGDIGNTQRNVGRAVHYYCAMRQRAVPVVNYVVGFGSGADPTTNSFFAAAGGTGECCRGSGCSYQASEIFDPCTELPHPDNVDYYDVSSIMKDRRVDPNKLTCRGALQADNAQTLKDTLLALAGNVSCTFPLEIPDGYPAGDGAYDDPEATRVQFDHAIFGNNIRIPALDPNNPDRFYNDLINIYGVSPTSAEPYRGEGWNFSDNTRRAVRLTEKLCAEVRSDNVQITETQVACLCLDEGEACDVPCGQDPDAGCEMDVDGNMVQSGRCRPGTIACNLGVPFCQKHYSPQPEICNGIDDNCDGVIDNMETADPAQNSEFEGDGPGREFNEWDENMTPLDARGLGEGLFCAFQSVCVCNDGGNPLGPIPSGSDNEWELMLDTYKNSERCFCIAGLEPGGAPAYGDASGDGIDEANACTISALHPSAPNAGFGFLGLLGLLAAFNIRRARREARV